MEGCIVFFVSELVNYKVGVIVIEGDIIEYIVKGEIMNGNVV